MVEFDPKQPTVARVYDSLIGGKDNFGPDREVCQQLDAICPHLVKFVAENRHFLERAVRYVAERGVSQFIDLGAGLPRPPMTHETAREVNPVARAVYVDEDPQVLAHLTAWYGNNDDSVTVVKSDVADHRVVLAAARGVLDLTGPCCLILGMIPHFFEAAAARALMAAYLDAAAPGSYLIASSAYSTHPRAAEFWETYSSAVRPIYPHSPEVFATFFGAAELIPPGIGESRTWRPGWPAKAPLDTTRAILCAVGRKPG